MKIVDVDVKPDLPKRGRNQLAGRSLTQITYLCINLPYSITTKCVVEVIASMETGEWNNLGAMVSRVC